MRRRRYLRGMDYPQSADTRNFNREPRKNSGQVDANKREFPHGLALAWTFSGRSPRPANNLIQMSKSTCPSLQRDATSRALGNHPNAWHSRGGVSHMGSCGSRFIGSVYGMSGQLFVDDTPAQGEIRKAHQAKEGESCEFQAGRPGAAGVTTSANNHNHAVAKDPDAVKNGVRSLWSNCLATARK